MSRSFNQQHKTYDFPKRIVKDLTKAKARAQERQVIHRYLTGQIEEVVLDDYNNLEDVWYYD